MKHETARPLLSELSSCLLMANPSNSSDLQEIEEILTTLEQCCTTSQWEIIAEIALNFLNARVLSNPAAPIADGCRANLSVALAKLTDACCLLEKRLYLDERDKAHEASQDLQEPLGDAAGNSSSPTSQQPSETQLSNIAPILDDWGFDEQPSKSVSTVVLSKGMDDKVAHSSEAERVHLVEREREEIENMVDFYSEAREAVERNEAVLMLAKRGVIPPSDVDSLFRDFHSIKGIASFVGLRQASKLAHSTESLLGAVRQGGIESDQDILDLLLASNECMLDLSESVRQALENSTSIALNARVDPLCLQIEATCDRGRAKQPRRASCDLNLTAPENPLARSRLLSKRSAQSQLIEETLKIDVGRVDSLVEMVGEMVIVESMITGDHAFQNIRSQRLNNNLRQMAKISRDLQKLALKLRMIPVRSLFARTSRIVRELSRQLGKPVELEMLGEATEMDRRMVDLLAEPLLHMIRNAIDHGIESPSRRLEEGKPKVGKIRISAAHEGSTLVIEVSDDGAGLDRDALLARGIERGFISAEQSYSRTQTFELIFSPGFSTSESTTSVSGRGVGMDVVRKNIEAMRGRISIDSTLGEGTTFRLVLPLTLAIINGTLILCGKETYILPTLSIVESLLLQSSMVKTPAGGRGALLLRGNRSYPLHRLSTLLDIPGARELDAEAHAVLIESAGETFALMVDTVVSQQQVVIKPLAKRIESRIFSGAAILSSGNIGLIINVDEVAPLSNNRDRIGLLEVV